MADPRPPFRLQLNVVSPPRHPQAGAFPSGGVVLTEPMSRFRCNEKGCCCSGWDIPFKLEDFLRLHEAFDEQDKALLTKRLKLVLEPPKGSRPIDEGEQQLHSVKLAGVGDDQACRFLAAGGGCGVQVKYGLSALPDLCVDFPGFGYRRPDGPVELFFDPVCPEVLEQLDESDEPLRLHHQKEPFDWATQNLRAAHAATPLRVEVDGTLLGQDELTTLRAASVEAFANPERAPWETLAALLTSLSTLRPGEALGPAWPAAVADPMPFLRFLNRCIDASSAELLRMLFVRYRRFIHAIDPAPIFARTEVFERHLTDWRPAFGAWLAPQEEALKPLVSRYLAHRFSAPFAKEKGELRRAADGIAHLYGTALRYAAALGATLERPVDRALFKVALGASESFYRSVNLPRQSLPWFASAADSD